MESRSPRSPGLFRRSAIIRSLRQLSQLNYFNPEKLKPDTRVSELGTTIGEELLKVHLSYGPLLQALLKKFNPVGRPPAVKGLAHITGGGFVDNIPRVLPGTCDVILRQGSWELPPIFQMIQAKGGVPQAELYQVFNMGIGLTMIVAADKVDEALKFARGHRHQAWLIGEVVRGRGVTRVV